MLEVRLHGNLWWAMKPCKKGEATDETRNRSPIHSVRHACQHLVTCPQAPFPPERVHMYVSTEVFQLVPYIVNQRQPLLPVGNHVQNFLAGNNAFVFSGRVTHLFGLDSGPFVCPLCFDADKPAATFDKPEQGRELHPPIGVGIGLSKVHGHFQRHQEQSCKYQD
jgi:hypothetical protein